MLKASLNFYFQAVFSHKKADIYLMPAFSIYMKFGV